MIGVYLTGVSRCAKIKKAGNNMVQFNNENDGAKFHVTIVQSR